MIPLLPHPSTPESAWTVSAFAERTAANELRLRYRIDGVLAGLRVPPPGAPRRGDRLWEHTCVEAFVAADGTSAYVELNVAPSREWAAYAFTGYRTVEPCTASPMEPLAARLVAPQIDVRCDDATLALDVSIALAALSSAYVGTALRVGLSVVSEATSGRLSYWALHHPSVRPDFHHADGFVLRLAPPRGADSPA